MIIRFMRGTGWESTAIVWQEKACMPFPPSHVESLSRDGTTYIGAHIDDGVRARPIGYDKGHIAKLPTGYDASVFPDGLCDFLLNIPATPEQDDKFHLLQEARIGQPYDWKAIIGFLLPNHEHMTNHAICSAAVTLDLRGCGRFRWRLATPAHLVDPRDLLLMLSTHMQIPGV